MPPGSVSRVVFSRFVFLMCCSWSWPLLVFERATMYVLGIKLFILTYYFDASLLLLYSRWSSLCLCFGQVSFWGSCSQIDPYCVLLSLGCRNVKYDLISQFSGWFVFRLFFEGLRLLIWHVWRAFWSFLFLRCCDLFYSSTCSFPTAVFQHRLHIPGQPFQLVFFPGFVLPYWPLFLAGRDVWFFVANLTIPWFHVLLVRWLGIFWCSLIPLLVCSHLLGIVLALIWALDDCCHCSCG